MVATPPARAYLSMMVVAAALLAATGIVTAPAATLDALIERSGAGALVPALLPVGMAERSALALLAGGVVALIGAGAPFVLPPRRRRPTIVAAGDGAMPVIRRADAHPDAPPRRPIRASSDLGAPLPIAAEQQASIATHGVSPAEAALPADLDQPLAAFDPGAIPAEPLTPAQPLPPLARLEPVTPREDEPVSETIGDLLARLERRRQQRDGALPAVPAGPVPAPSLADTLERLRQLATR